MTFDAGLPAGPNTLEMRRWADRGACRQEIDAGRALAAWWFPEQSMSRGGTTWAAKAICDQCPVKAECLRWAIKHGERGIWGGTGERERARMPERFRDCLECGREFSFTAGRGGNHPTTCSEACKEIRIFNTKRSYEQRTNPNFGTRLEEGHGTYTAYVKGCRCLSCRRASREYRRTRRAS